MIVYLKVCEHDILKTACDNFTKFTTSVHLGTKMNFLDFEVKRSKDQYHVWSDKHFGMHFFTCLRNAWNIF